MAPTGIRRIDDLFAGLDSGPIQAGDQDKEAVAIVQELLICQGFIGLPRILDSARGTFGPKTTGAVREFQKTYSFPETGTVDTKTLHALISIPAVKPKACHAYLALVLDFVYEGMLRLVSLTSQFEGAGSFTAFNANTDGAGLSFGLIQWAQKPGRLYELLCAFRDQRPIEFLKIFGASDARLTEGLLKHTSRPGGGVDEDGQSTDPDYELTKDPWRTRFRAASLHPELQKAQVRCALEAFTRSYRHLKHYAASLKSERSIAFMLDLANQHGDGGARNIFEHVFRPGLSEPDFLSRLQEESVERVRHQFGGGPEVASTRNRREAFRTSRLLSDEACEF